MMEPLYVLLWHRDMGIDTLIEEEPLNAFMVKKHIEAVKAAKREVEGIKANIPHTTSVDSANGASTKPQHAPAIIKSPSSAKLATQAIADKVQTLDELREAITQFDGLAITKTATNTVFADGSPNAQVLFMGEAPGADEDREGIPFCGQSGQVLRQVIHYIGLIKTNNYYISNSVFWRPPGNRKPTPEELAICRPFVQKHIALLNPKLIVAVGSTAVASILEKNDPISKIRGKLFDYQNPYLDHPIPVMPVFHPSYLLRAPAMKKYVWQDALKIQEFVDKLPKANHG